MKIAIGSTSATEIEAAKEAWSVFAGSILEEPDEEVEFLSYRVPEEVREMPLDTTGLIKGAQDRVENLIFQLKREKTEADYYIGLQAGFNVVDSQGPRRRAFLESWAYVSDGHHGSLGHGGGIAVPPRIANPVIDRGIELSIVMERFSKEKGLQSDEGTWGLLTRDILSVRHAFVIALIAAFAPFYNREAYETT
jgi:non-canonical (house-cleaning) NTP pyrophosphatase